MTEKVKHRLEQLDDFTDAAYHMQDVSQQEYVSRIEQLNMELVQAWNNDHRVTALKIAIQCSKLLADTSVMQFYPSQFVLITDILDIFGKLVYDRLKVKAGYIRLVDKNQIGMGSCSFIKIKFSDLGATIQQLFQTTLHPTWYRRWPRRLA